MSEPEDDEPDGPRRSKRQLAVALEYDPDSGDAPRIVASGQGTVAEQILQIAFARGVKVREDPDLAELLATVDVDSEIPVEAFAAVAEILVYLYRVNGHALPFEDEDDGSAADPTQESPDHGP